MAQNYKQAPKFLLYHLLIGLSSRGAEKWKQTKLQQHGAFGGQLKTRWNVNMKLRGKGTPRAAGQERGGAEEDEQEVKPEKGEKWRTKWGTGVTRVSFSVTQFHMVEPLFKRPITL